MTTSADAIERLLASAPERVAGFPAFAPDLANGGEDYPEQVFPELAAIEESSFWFQARNRILLRAFAKYVGPGPAWVLEIGCGTGFVMKGLAERFPAYELVGAEAFVSGLAFARDRVARARFCQLDATRMPFVDAFDAVGFFDVLEHLDADVAALRGAHTALRADGWLFVTVPQHERLWSGFDVASGHKRRYSRNELVAKVGKAGFDVRWVSSFVTTLLPALVLKRRGSSPAADATAQAIRDLSPGGFVNFVAATAMRVDEFLMDCGISLPAGGSLLLVARKRG